MKRVLISSGILALLALSHGYRQAMKNPTSGATAHTGSTPPTAQVADAVGIRWAKSMPAALEVAARTKKPIMVDFYATWCGPCKMLDQDVYTDQAVIEQSQNWIALKVDVDKDQELATRYGITNLPTIALLKPDGTVITGFKGVPSAARLVEVMQSSLDKTRAG